MRSRAISIGILSAWLILFSLSPSQVHADNWPQLIVDQDGDGLADSIENAGWYNAAGGPFKTNPLNPDSDGDGLTDGEEKLFNTNPLNKSSPGLWVEYRDDFQTRQYYHATNNAEPFPSGGGPNPVMRGGGYLHWEKGGHRQIMTEAMVVRRGTTFRLHGPPGASLTITKHQSSQSNLAVSSRFCQGSGWDITVDPNETVGIYTATATLGSWSDSIPIYVIFKLPTPYNGSGFNKVTQADIEAFLYDDDPTNLRDETSVWWIPREGKYNYTCADHLGQPCDNEPYKIARAFAQVFWTDQFKKYVFRDQVMPKINGANNPLDAADQLTDGVDNEIRVWYSGLGESTFRALFRAWDGTGYYVGSTPNTQSGGWGCDVHAGVLGGYSRAAGILARPFQIDWSSSENIGGAGAYHGETVTGGWNDNSVLIWNDQNWQILRAFSTEELSDIYYPWDEDNQHAGPQTISAWTINRYSDRKGDGVVTVDSTWQLSDVNTVWPPWDDISGGSSFGTNWEYYWDSRKPLQIRRHPMVQMLNEQFWKGDGWEPNDFSPQVYQLPGDLNLNENWPYNPVPTGCSPSVTDCPFGSSLTSQEVDPSQAPENNLSSVSDNTLAGAKFTDKITHQASDGDGDGVAESLLVELGLDLSQPGTYTVLADLYDANNAWGGTASWSGNLSKDGSGAAARLQFKQALHQPGPYTLRGVYLIDELGRDYDSRSGITLTALPAVGGPARIGVMPAGGGISARGLTITPTLTFNHSTTDPDGDGKFNSLIVNAGMTVSQAGTYRLEGWLVAANGDLVGWAQSAPQTLGVGNQILSLTFDGRVINDRKLSGPYTLEALKVLDGNLSAYNVLDQVHQTGFSLNYNPQQFETTLLFSDNMENGTGQWSSSSVWNLTEAGSFSSSHAWLANAGSNQSGNLTTITLNTTNYADPVLRFQSCVEAGGTTNGLVQLSTDNGSTWTQVDTYANGDEPWVSKQLNLAAYEKQPNLRLRFRAQAGGSSSLKWYLDDVQLNGWPAVTNVGISYTPLGPIQPGQPVTFRANYSTIDSTMPVSYEWHIDGVKVGAGSTLTHTFNNTNSHQVQVTVSNPHDSASASGIFGGGIPVSSANFTAVQTSMSNPNKGTFTASYLPGNTTNEPPDHGIKYTWNFGDGSSPQTLTIPNLDHNFPGNGLYTVILTVSNGFGTPVVIQKQVPIPFDDDEDGLSNETELSLGTNPKKPDSDNDGLLDGQEVNGFVYHGHSSHPDNGQTITTNPLDSDSDNDGLLDGEEADPVGGLTTHPKKADTDGDGIPDGTEVGANPNQPRNTDGDTWIDGIDPDSDNDTIPDAAEWDVDQNSSNSDNLCGNKNIDIDADGIPNCQDNDADGDGTPNYRDIDSDGDVTLDKVEGTGDEDNDGVPNFLDRGIIRNFIPFLLKEK